MLTNKQKLEAIFWLRTEFDYWLTKEQEKNQSRWYGWAVDFKRFLSYLETELLKNESKKKKRL